jgi:ABC-2 type transport system ATP-binding protein
LQVENVTKVFRDFWHRPKVTAVREVSFEVKRGEVFGLLGPNGSGKSTTIKMMLGLLHPTRGHLRVLGRSPREVRAKARVGYLPEESYLYPYLTSEETLDFYGRLFDLNRAERRSASSNCWR